MKDEYSWEGIRLDGSTIDEVVVNLEKEKGGDNSDRTLATS
jgi:hypothetical protein